jgi:16S rRNA (cytidine1402-2'-O)-methyltransferase
VSVAHASGAIVKPLVGPSSILLALMASGLNGQQFQFTGYLPIDNAEKIKALKQLESESEKKNCTQVFIETPYRNNQLLETIIRVCKPSTYLCVAADITSADEWIKTKTIAEWRKQLPDLHKRPAIFCLLGAGLS